jgi:hypothetical protein
MEILLTVAVVVTALAIIVQAGALAGMYLMSRRLTNEVNSLVQDSRRLMTPLETVANNLKASSDDVVDMSKLTREEIRHLQQVTAETAESLRAEINDVRIRVNETVDEARNTVMSPLREWSAIARGLAEGLRVFFRRRRPPESPIRETPAA